MSSARHGSPLPAGDRWARELLEERFKDPWQTSEELRTRAEQLRTEAAKTDVKGIRDATLTLAERYGHAAAAR